MGRTTASILAVVVLAAAALAVTPALGDDTPAPLTALTALAAPNYTGGLTRVDRAIAERIHAAMAARYAATCASHDPRAGALLGFSSPVAVEPLAADTDPDLVALIKALDSPVQEVRDVAAYTIGLLGPSAKAAESILASRFNSESQMGGWYNFAYARVSCQEVTPPDFRRTISPSLLPPPEPWPAFRNAAVILMAKLYLDENVEYPPGMMSDTYLNYGFGDIGVSVSLLSQILGDDRLSLQKRREAAEALSSMEPQFLLPAKTALERAVRAPDLPTRHYAGQALVKLKDEAAIPALIEDISYKDWAGDWSDQLCVYGHAAIAAQDRLLDTAQHSTWPRVIRAAVRALGCIGSQKSLPLLTDMLMAPDWQLNMVAAIAIGRIGVADAGVLAQLRLLAGGHWSKKVRTTAQAALDQFAAKPSLHPAAALPRPEGGIETIIGGSPRPFDHGLPWCDGSGRYSIDGKLWFSVTWLQPRLEDVPKGFRGLGWLQTVGSRTFLRVDGGWLVGSDGFEGEGVLMFVSDDGAIQSLAGDGEPPTGDDATIEGIAQAKGRIYAFGYEILRIGPVGSLFDISRQPDGTWKSVRVLALPSVPYSHAIAPSGELLLSDGPNDYAIVDNQIVPLKCERVVPGSYFDKNRENDLGLR